MKIINQWIVFNKNTDHLLIETESGKYFIQTRYVGFTEISKSDAEKLIAA